MADKGSSENQSEIAEIRRSLDNFERSLSANVLNIPN